MKFLYFAAYQNFLNLKKIHTIRRRQKNTTGEKGICDASKNIH